MSPHHPEDGDEVQVGVRVAADTTDFCLNVLERLLLKGASVLRGPRNKAVIDRQRKKHQEKPTGQKPARFGVTCVVVPERRRLGLRPGPVLV